VAFFGNVVLFLALIVAVVFSLLVLVTGKGDAMSGGGSVRTTFKGKASFDDIISKWTLIMGVSFMALVLLYTVVSNRVNEANLSVVPGSSAAAPESNSSAPQPADSNKPAEAANTPAPDANKPAEAANAPAEATNAPAATDTNKPAADANAPAADANAPAAN
jgi:preprotein translocase subunit SecG